MCDLSKLQNYPEIDK